MTGVGATTDGRGYTQERQHLHLWYRRLSVWMYAEAVVR